MRMLKISLFVIPFLTTASFAHADYYIGHGKCDDGDRSAPYRECKAAGVSGPTNGVAVAVCCKSSNASSKYKDEAGEQESQD